MGKIPQLKNVIYDFHIENPMFIENLKGKYLNKKPLLASVVLDDQAAKTNMLAVGGGIGFTNGLIINHALKRVLDIFDHFGVQFFETEVIQGQFKDLSYWQVYAYDEFGMQLMDFTQTVVALSTKKKGGPRTKTVVDVKNYMEYETLVKETTFPNQVSLEKVFFKEELRYDFFLFDYRYVISERLKAAIENQGLTGMEFMPTHMTYGDWIEPGGPREKTYGRSY